MIQAIMQVLSCIDLNAIGCDTCDADNFDATWT
jgi:hypothetical protein